MAIIKIKQDNPELVAAVRGQIEEMVERTRKHPRSVIGPMAEEFVRGYLAALVLQGLLSIEQWKQLTSEATAAARAADEV